MKKLRSRGDEDVEVVLEGLKALGFGSANNTQSPAPPSLAEHIGRLDESQLRQLDEKHQAASLSPIIVRRGRPWKGTGASPESVPKAERKYQTHLTDSASDSSKIGRAHV